MTVSIRRISNVKHKIQYNFNQSEGEAVEAEATEGVEASVADVGHHGSSVGSVAPLP